MKERELKLLGNSIRKSIIEMLYEASSGHPGGALGMTDLFAVLYSEVLKHDPKKKDWKERDYVFLSNGHTCPVLYATLAEFGYFPKKELKSLRKLGSKLQGHPHVGSVSGVENSGGPLGQGLSQAVGLAAYLKRSQKKNRVYCFVGDGELEEGQCWEALLFAAKEQLDNFILIVDRNGIQIDGETKNIMPLEPLSSKFTSFNFASIECEGNNYSHILMVFDKARQIQHKPVVIIAKTLAGKGVSFMEGDYHWHGKAPNKEEKEQALVDLYIERSQLQKGGKKK